MIPFQQLGRRSLVLWVLMSISGFTVFGNGEVLHLPDGRAVEVSVVFEIKEMNINSDGMVSMDLRTTLDGKEVGFALKASEFIQGGISILGTRKQLPVCECEIILSHSGELTQRLESHLRQMFSYSNYDDKLFLGGTYRAFSYDLRATLMSPSVFNAHGVLLPVDRDGKSIITGENFDIRFIFDAPFNRVVGYFSIPPGYGGSSTADSARKHWFESLSKK